MATENESVQGMSRYAPLGMFANPFQNEGFGDAGADGEIRAAADKLLSKVFELSRQESPKPLWVEKSETIPSQYPLTAVGRAEHVLATDDDMNVMYTYVPFYSFKIGPTRSTLGLLSERLAFRSFDRTLAAYVETILAEPDTTLASYQVLGPDRLESFAAMFREDPLEAVHACFGDPVVERRPELEQVADMRQLQMDHDILEESDVTAEIDETVGDAPGMNVVLGERAEEEAANAEMLAVRDYLIEHTNKHLSVVVARALRVFVERGLRPMAMEFRITKAPRKTLGAIVKLALLRFEKVAILYDNLEQWLDVDQDLRSKLVGSLSEIRWKLAGDAFLVFFASEDTAPELHEAFGNGPRIEWDFADLPALEEQRGVLLPDIVDKWLAAATLVDATPKTLADPVLAKLAEAADGQLMTFKMMAYAAIEDAASRGVDLDQAAYEAGVSAGQQVES